MSSLTAARVAAIRSSAAEHASRNPLNPEDVAGACLICAGPLESCCVLPCGHSDMCVMCVARVRLLSGNRRCPLCKSDVERLVALASAELAARGGGAVVRFEDFGTYGDLCGPELTLDEESGIFFHSSARADLARLVALRTFSCNCQLSGGRSCAVLSDDLDALMRHTASAHGMYVCELCARHRAVFVAELPRLTAKRLRDHCSAGDASAGFAGHPLCSFCDARFYDDSALFAHLRKDHFSCHLCAATTTELHKYFNKYEDLEAHFGRRHFACTHAECVRAHFVAFSTAIDLQAHAASVHGETADVLPLMPFKFKTSSTHASSRGGGARRGGGAGSRGTAGGAGGGAPRTADERGVIIAGDDFAGDDSDSGGEAGGGGRISRITFEATDFPSLSLVGGDGGTSAAGGGPGGGVGFARAVSSAGITGPRFHAQHNPLAFPALPAAAAPPAAARHSSGSFARQHLSAYTSVDALLAMTGQAHLISGTAASAGAAGGAGASTRQRDNAAANAAGGSRQEISLAALFSPPASRAAPLSTTSSSRAGDSEDTSFSSGSNSPRPPAHAALAKSRPLLPEPLTGAGTTSKRAPPTASNDPSGSSSPAPAGVPQLCAPAAAAAGHPEKVTPLKAITVALAHLSDGMSRFKVLSKSFRGKEIGAATYVSSAAELFAEAEALALSASDNSVNPMLVFSRAMRPLIELVPDIGLRVAGVTAFDAWLATAARKGLLRAHADSAAPAAAFEPVPPATRLAPALAPAASSKPWGGSSVAAKQKAVSIVTAAPATVAPTPPSSVSTASARATSLFPSLPPSNSSSLFPALPSGGAKGGGWGNIRSAHPESAAGAPGGSGGGWATAAAPMLVPAASLLNLNTGGARSYADRPSAKAANETGAGLPDEIDEDGFGVDGSFRVPRSVPPKKVSSNEVKASSNEAPPPLKPAPRERKYAVIHQDRVSPKKSLPDETSAAAGAESQRAAWGPQATSKTPELTTTLPPAAVAAGWAAQVSRSLAVPAVDDLIDDFAGLGKQRKGKKK